MPAIPAMRVLHHEYIIESVKKVALLYRVAGSSQINDTNPNAHSDTVQVLNATITRIRKAIELSALLDENSKYKWLRSANEMLTGFCRPIRPE